jgi:hypothetical protein
MWRIIKCTLALIGILMVQSPAQAQKVALKSNLLMDATLSPNLGIEVGIAPRWTLDLSGQINAWTLSHGRKWKHWMVQPEARYWFCERFNRHFLAIHLQGGEFNAGNFDGLRSTGNTDYGCHGFDFLGTEYSRLYHRRFEGWFAGAGIGYGYSWILSKHWNLEFEIGVGYNYARYDQFKDCEGCSTKEQSDKEHHYVGPTKAALSLVYGF